MNFVSQMYADLMSLVERDEAFFFKDYTFEDKVYRIFNYRLASWTSFQSPNALNARGVMFDVTDSQNVSLASLPPAKFFNYEEGNVDHSVGVLGDKMIKMDGSLISSYLHNGQLYLKSKGALFSEQAVAAMKLLNSEGYVNLKNELTALAKLGFTINMEYTSPENRIVIPYQEEKLTVLSARSQLNGENFFATKLKDLLLQMGGYSKTVEAMVAYEDLRGKVIDIKAFMDVVHNEQEGEGYVIEVVLPDGTSYLFKGKNLKYIALHQTKDSVNSPKKLFEAIIEEASDDLRSMFSGDTYVLNKIEEMEKLVQPVFNHIVKTTEDFYAVNKGMVRKDFALLAQKEIPKYMSLAMNLYSGKTNNYKEYAKKMRKELFGVTDVEPEQLDE
jgi:T4 RnlA family RNA ligase